MYICYIMVKVDNNLSKNLKGLLFKGETFVGEIDNAHTFINVLCQIKSEKESDYRMEVEIEIAKDVRRTYVYKFTPEGKMIPSSYPNVSLWIDQLNSELLYLYGFKVNFEKLAPTKSI